MNRVIRSFRDLDTWQVAVELAVECYKIVKGLPASERFEMSAQLRKSCDVGSFKRGGRLFDRQ